MDIPKDVADEYFGRLHVRMGVYWYYLKRDGDALVATHISPGMEEMTGLTRGQLEEPDAWAQLIAPASKKAAYERRGELLTPGTAGLGSPNYMEFRIYGKPNENGERPELLIGDYCYQDVNADGQVVGLFGIARNLTGLKQAIENEAAAMAKDAVNADRRRCNAILGAIVEELATADAKIKKLVAASKLPPETNTKMVEVSDCIHRIRILSTDLMAGR